MAEMKLIGAVGIKVRPVAKDFKRELNSQINNLPEKTVEVKVDADTRPAEQKLKKTIEAAEREAITLRYEVDYDGLRQAEQTVRQALKRIADKPVTIDLNTKSLNNALADIEKRLKNAQVSVNFAQDEAGYRSVLAKIEQIKRQKIETSITFRTNDKDLAAEEARVRKLLEQEVINKGIKISYVEDRDGLTKAIAAIDDALRGLKEVEVNPKLTEKDLLEQQAELQKKLDAIPLEITFNNDREGILKAIEEIEKLQRAAEITLKYKDDEAGLQEILDQLNWELDNNPATIELIPDKKGYEAALAQIEELQRQASSIEFEYDTNEDGLREAADRLRMDIAALTVSPTIDFKYKDDTNGLKGAMAQIDRELEKLGLVTITANLDEGDLIKKKAELEKKLSESSFVVSVNTKDIAALSRERDKIKQLLREEASEQVSLVVAPNEESLRDAKDKIDQMIREAELNPVNLDVEPVGLALAAAQIGWASRSRVVPFYIRIDNKSRAVAEGVLKSLSGYNTLSSIGNTIENVATNFDTVIAKGGSLTAVIGNLVNTLAYGATNLLSVGEGVAEVVGLAATAPAALSAAAAVVLVNVAAFKDFKAAIDGTKGALEKLPPNAQAAALALRGTWEAIQQPIQNAYWESMGTSLQDMVTTLLPKVRDGLTEAGRYIGLFAKNTADTLNQLGSTDMFDKMFGYLGTFFKNAAGIAEPLTRAINTLGLRGSEYLPQFGMWLTEISTQFNDWITAADQAGDINVWIENGVTSLKDMWRAGDGVLDVIRGITKASMDAGGQTLGGLADEMQRWGEIVNGEPFQTRLTQILAGARQGATNLNAGFKDLTASVGESAGWLGDMLELLGQLGGVTLTNLSSLFRSGSFTGGIYEAVSGLTDMMTALGPSFTNLADTFGVLGNVAGATFRGLAPLINVVTGALKSVADILGDELPGIATALTGQLTGTFSAIAAVITLAARAVEPLLQGFLALPDAIQTVLLAAGGFMIMRGQISKMLTVLHEKGHFKAFEGSWTSAREAAGTNASRIGVAAQMVQTSVGGMATKTTGALGGIGASWRNYRTEVGKAQGAIATASTAMTMPVQKAAGLVKTGLGSVVSLFGGPWGAALAAGAAGVSLFAQANAEAKARVDNLAQSLEQQTGALGDNTKKLIATDWMQSATGKWDNFFRGVMMQSKAAHETVKILGDSTEDVTNLIAEGGPEYDAYVDKLKLISEHLGGAKIKESGGFALAAMSMEELSKATGYSVEALRKLDASDVGTLRKQVEGTRDDLSLAEQKVKDVSLAMGVGKGEAESMGAAMETLGEESSTASERVEAMKTALDRLSSGEMSQQEAARNFAKVWESSMEQVKTAATDGQTGVKGSLDHLVSDVDGSILQLDGQGGQLFDATKSLSDALMARSTAASQHILDNKGTTEEAAAAAVKALQMTEPELEAWAENVGVSTDKARLMLQNFTGEDWQAQAILGADASLFFQEMAKAQARGEVFGEEEWDAVLRARNLTAAGLNEAMADGKNWTDAQLNAVLRAMPDSAKATLAETLGVMDDAWMRGDFSALMTALDGTEPGVSAALFAIAAVTDGNYEVPLKALADALALEQAKGELDGAANADRSAHITAVPHTGDAQLAFEMTADDRDAHITGRPHTEDANNRLNTTANPRDSHITGRPHTEDANSRLNTTANPRDARITGRPETGTAEDRLNRTGRNRESWFNGRENLYATNNALNHLARNRNPWFIAQADTAHAAGQLAALSAQRTVYYRAVVENPGIRALHGAIVNGSGVQTFANGGILTPQVKRYASGGYENHIAEISRGQTPYRIWSEPETGGEAYIPLSPQKRARSTQILEQVATQFGMKLMDSNATRYANGGIVDGGRTGQGVSVNIGSYVTSQTDTPDDVARALMRRIKVQGANSPLEAF